MFRTSFSEKCLILRHGTLLEEFETPCSKIILSRQRDEYFSIERGLGLSVITLMYIVRKRMLPHYQELGCSHDSTFSKVTSIKLFSSHLSKMKCNLSASFGRRFRKVDT